MIPSHVAIILDGNRRYAKKLGLNPIKGHEYGAKKLIDILKWLKEAGVKQATLYTFSTENMKRNPIEVGALITLFSASIKKALNDKRIEQNKTRIKFIGRLEILPKGMQKDMKELMEKTKNYSDFTVNFAMGYGGKAEIVDAAKKLAADAKSGRLKEEDITEETFAKYLYIADEPDLLIRPGGEKRLSNFLPWQLAYSEFIFLDKLLPELTRQDILDCISEYEKRDRRKGK